MLLIAAILFGGVYLWTGLFLAAVITGLLVAVGPRLAATGPLRTLDLALAALLGAVLLQMVPLPHAVVRAVSPSLEAFRTATSLQRTSSSYTSLSLDPTATAHAWVSLLCIAATFWVARTVFARGGIRTFSTIMAWGAIAIALVAFAQQASGTTLVYGFWRPRDGGARPLGPFINRNHLGTWGIMAACLCAGYLQWRDGGGPAGGSWRASMARWLDGRRMVLQLAVVLMASVIALGASRSSLVALACAAGYVALSAPAGRGKRRRRLSLAALAAFAVVAMMGYGDGQRLRLRMDETRATGMANRIAIWRDGLPLMRDFPLTGVGAGAFGSAMRVYQSSPRTYHYNEAHNQYLQLAAEGGVLLILPAGAACLALIASAWTQLRRRDDPLRWMRVAATGALVGVAVQSIWETGLTLPANGMLAAALAGLIVHVPAHADRCKERR